jgi:hypothetical protein
MAAADPLTLLVDSLSDPSNEIRLLSASEETVFELSQAVSISFPSPSGRTSIPKTAPTRLHNGPIDLSNPPKPPEESPSEYYDVGALLIAFLNKDKPVGDYIREASKQGVTLVGTVERRSVVEYLAGKNDGEGRVLPIGGIGELPPVTFVFG